jgi:uncharacterized protein with ACT and thioredoxin-like domain
LVAGTGCEHERRHCSGGGGVEVDVEIGEQLNHVYSAERCRGVNGKRAIISGGGAKSRTVPVSAINEK